jgi:hypothetical protein
VTRDPASSSEPADGALASDEADALRAVNGVAINDMAGGELTLFALVFSGVYTVGRLAWRGGSTLLRQVRTRVATDR